MSKALPPFKHFAKSLLGFYLFHKTYKLSTSDTQTSVLFEFSNFTYSRYFFNLAFFLNHTGISIGIRYNASTFYELHKSQYSNLIIKDNLVTFVSTKDRSKTFKLFTENSSKPTLSQFDFSTKSSPSYQIPMAQHPLMYRDSLWDQPVGVHSQKGTFLFIGNTQKDVYSRNDSIDRFKITDRYTLIEYLKNRGPLHYKVNDLSSSQSPSNQSLIVESQVCQVPISEVRPLMARFKFFLCAPGSFMPLCHNIVESLSVGCIPILQKPYADAMRPRLKHNVNCLIFSDIESLEEILTNLKTFPIDQYELLRKNALHYYQRFLHPKAVSETILSPSTERLQLLAGKQSVELMKGETT